MKKLTLLTLCGLLIAASQPATAGDNKEDILGAAVQFFQSSGAPIEFVTGYDSGVYTSVGNGLVATDSEIEIKKNGAYQFQLEGTGFLDLTDPPDPRANVVWGIFRNQQPEVLCATQAASAAAESPNALGSGFGIIQCNVQVTLAAKAGDVVSIGYFPAFDLGANHQLLTRIEVTRVALLP